MSSVPEPKASQRAATFVEFVAVLVLIAALAIFAIVAVRFVLAFKEQTGQTIRAMRQEFSVSAAQNVRIHRAMMCVLSTPSRQLTRDAATRCQARFLIPGDLKPAQPTQLPPTFPPESPSGGGSGTHSGHPHSPRPHPSPQPTPPSSTPSPSSVPSPAPSPSPSTICLPIIGCL